MRSACTLALLLVACASRAPGVDEASSGDTAADADADGEDPERLAQLAELVWDHLDPEARAAATTDASDVTADRDGDGIADALEEALLRRYRPYYRFSKDGDKDEDRRPADPLTELSRAQLKPLNSDGAGAGDPICAPSDEAADGLASSLFTCRPDASFVNAGGRGAYCLSIDKSRYGGVSFDEARAKATGLLGHVTADTVNGHPAYKLEYWQFFAFNNQDVTFLGLGSFGDHEGDWTAVELWFDRELHRLAKVEYAIHGQTVRFDIPEDAPTGRSAFVEVKGARYSTNVGNFFDDNARRAYDDNEAEFWMDDRGYRHVVVYIERGGHEFWPGAWGHAEPASFGPVKVRLDSHDGKGPSYLVPDVDDRPFNVGEVERPLTAAARVVLAYDGLWGCTNTRDVMGRAPLRKSPIGPPLHCEWRWPNRSALDGCEN